MDVTWSICITSMSSILFSTALWFDASLRTTGHGFEDLRLLGHPDRFRNSAWNAPVDVALPSHRVRRSEVDERRLLQKPDRQVELFRDALRRHVTVARPHDVLDVQPVVLLLVALPDTNLEKNE